MSTSSKLDGQIWIEKNAPYKLKYHMKGQDFAIDTSIEYNIIDDNANAKPNVGNLVKINASGELEKASFPNDLKNVIGVLVSTVNNKGVVATSGYVEIEKEMFLDKCSVGDEVYWYNTDSYKYNTNTPNSIIKYVNLPSIGTISSINNDTVTVHLNIGPFDTSIEWYAEGSFHQETSGTIEVNHNLTGYFSYRTSLNILTDKQYYTAYCSSSDNGDGTATFNIKCINDFDYRASGVVIYEQ